MAKPAQVYSRPRDLQTAVVVTAVIVGALYWAHEIFIGIFLSVFLAFILNPAVRLLERRGLGRTISVLACVLTLAVVIGCVFWLVTSELYGLVTDLPTYTSNITSKIRSLKNVGDSTTLQRLDSMVEQISREWNGHAVTQSSAPAAAPAESNGDKQMIVVQPRANSPMLQFSYLAGAFSRAAVFLGLVFVLVFFILLRRELLRSRVFRILGGRLARTTKALDDAGERISRYLYMQFFINVSFGAAWTLGLYLLGIDYAVLWGVLAAMLRYIPYAGTILAGSLPVIQSIAISPGWAQPLGAVGVYLALETITNSLLEPYLYRQSMGVSEVALIISIAFWTLLWGPLGLVLAAPLTVCLAVLGKHVPRLSGLALLLGDEPVLEPHVNLYQRLLARDQDEAFDLVLAKAKESKAEDVYDTLLIPCLNYMKQDRAVNSVSEEDEQFIINAIAEIMEELGVLTTDEQGPATAIEPGGRFGDDSRVQLIACPTRSAGDQLSLEMLRQVLNPQQWEVQILPHNTLASELLKRVADTRARVVCVTTLPPGGLAHSRYMCKRLRSQFPDLKIAIGRWAPKRDIETDVEGLKDIGADFIGTSILETRDQLNAWLPVFAEAERHAAAV